MKLKNIQKLSFLYKIRRLFLFSVIGFFAFSSARFGSFVLGVKIPNLDLLLGYGLFNALLILLEEFGAVVFCLTFQVLIRKPSVETRVVFLFRFLTLLTNTIHSGKK